PPPPHRPPPLPAAAGPPPPRPPGLSLLAVATTPSLRLTRPGGTPRVQDQRLPRFRPGRPPGRRRLRKTCSRRQSPGPKEDVPFEPTGQGSPRGEIMANKKPQHGLALGAA